MDTMSEIHLIAITTLVNRELRRIEATQRNLETLTECEHPDWGEPGAEDAHKAALNALWIRNKRREARNLNTEKIKAARKRDRKTAGLDESTSTSSPLCGVTNCTLSSCKNLTLKPSTTELSKGALEPPPQIQIEPKDVLLPPENGKDEFCSEQLPATFLDSSSSCQTITTRSLATLMRRLDRCPITPSAFEQLQQLREGTQALLSRIQVAWGWRDAKLKRRAREWWWWRRRRARMTSSSLSERAATGPGIARGRKSQLSFYTAAEDADDPFGQKDARCEGIRFSFGSPWESNFTSANQNVDWNR